MMSRNVAGQTKKTIVIANNFIWWSAGNAAGSQVFLVSPVSKTFSHLAWNQKPHDDNRELTARVYPPPIQAREAPKYFTAFASHIGCYALLVIILIFFRWHLSRENKRRDNLAAAGVREAADERMVHAFEDLTDRENPNFRYVL